MAIRLGIIGFGSLVESHLLPAVEAAGRFRVTAVADPVPVDANDRCHAAKGTGHERLIGRVHVVDGEGASNLYRATEIHDMDAL